MDGKIDLARRKRGFDFLGKQPLATNLRKRAVLNAIPCRGNDPDIKRVLVAALCRREPGTHETGLRQRQRRTARADANLAGICHLRRLGCLC